MISSAIAIYGRAIVIQGNTKEEAVSPILKRSKETIQKWSKESQVIKKKNTIQMH